MILVFSLELLLHLLLLNQNISQEILKKAVLEGLRLKELLLGRRLQEIGNLLEVKWDVLCFVFYRKFFLLG